jgi:hypothetical protein
MNEPKEPLFHYTSIQGLIGILTDRKIWATNISHLNDKQELFEARDMFREAIQELEKAIDPSPMYAISPRGYKENPKIEFLSSLNHFLNLAELVPIFVCSFSEKGDQLSQWRGYCPNAYGFSIGFNYTRLKNHADRQRLLLKKCIYEKNQQKKIVDEYVQDRIVPRFSDLADKAKRGMNGWTTFREILEILPTIKNEHFAEESEWRLISSAFSIPQDTMKFRPGKTAIIPYCEFELAEKGKDLPVERINIGPTPNKDESLLSLKALLGKEHMEETVKINHSAIPYREI